jgi:soluble lytic murein transglycosylase
MRWRRTTGTVVVATGLLLVGTPQSVVRGLQHFTESQLWMAPADEFVGGDIAHGLAHLAEQRYAEALSALTPAVGDPALGSYARLHVARAQIGLRQFADAERTARQLLATTPSGALGERALGALAEALEGAGRPGDAAVVWQTMAGLGSAGAPAAILRSAQAAARAGDATTARTAYARVYYDYPMSEEATEASRVLARPGAPVAGPDVQRLELARAEKLFAAGRLADARRGYEGVAAYVGQPDRDQVSLRLAQIDVQQRRYATARDRLRPLRQSTAGSNVEVEFSWLGTLRGLRLASDYVVAVRQFVDRFGTHALVETALNDFATYYILADDDGRAAEVFTELYARFSAGRFSDRAAWRAGWWAYRHGNYREAIRFFESAALAMRRADYRPSWLYWAARAREQLGERDAAIAGYRQTIVFYRNSYYGRLASRAIARLLGGRSMPPPVPAPLALAPGAPPANATLIAALIRAGLYDDAIAELRAVQASGNTPIVEATVAYALSRKGELRPGITAMRRAYPQFMAEGGEHLPRQVLTTIFPIDHWDLIRRYAADRRLDPFLVTALMAQESTFQADVRSSANAWGLMQIIPSTGRRLALRVGLRGFTTALLTNPEINVRLGTAYLADLLAMFNGDVAPALASYNAGEHRVKQWRAERPGAPMDEFVEDIPFPETQNYVKRIVGTTEDYRILYGHLAPTVPDGVVR